MSNAHDGSRRPRGPNVLAKETAAEDLLLHNPPVDHGPEQFIASARENLLAKIHKLNCSMPRDPAREERIDHFVDTSQLVRAEITHAGFIVNHVWAVL